MNGITEIEEVIGFKTNPNEEILSEATVEKNENLKAILFIILGVALIIIGAFLSLSYLLVTNYIGYGMIIAGVLLVILGIYTYLFMRKRLRIIVTTDRIVEEFIDIRMKNAAVRDLHYRFFESVEILANTDSNEARMTIHLSSGDSEFWNLPREMIQDIINASRIFIGKIIPR
ncbi:MAG: hypothetical protein GF411_14585 [Candidatus Lokiarchaeota archaeon]|nr:hypothetical protein [Candidatus Lokiarchaeota archaeon]